MIKVGDLVRMRHTLDWNGQMGIVTKVRSSLGGALAILLTSGELIATTLPHRMEVINGQES